MPGPRRQVVQAAALASNSSTNTVRCHGSASTSTLRRPMPVSSALTRTSKTCSIGALRYRYLGPRPLTEDNAFRSPPTGLVNGQVGYRFDNGWRIQLDMLNLFNSKTDQISYAYGSLLKSDNLFALCYPAGGV